MKMNPKKQNTKLGSENHHQHRRLDLLLALSLVHIDLVGPWLYVLLLPSLPITTTLVSTTLMIFGNA